MYLFLFLFLSALFPINSFAAPSAATPTTDPKTEAVRQMTEKKVQDMLQQSGSSQSTVSTTTPKSLFGTITQISDDKVVITYKNETKNITVTDSTVFIDAKKAKVKLTSLKPGQIILAMGYYDEAVNFEAKRIIITTADAIENKNEIVLGKIADISQTSSVFVLIPIKNKENQYQIKTDSKTIIVDNDGNKLKMNQLKSGQKIIVVIQPDTKIAKTYDVSKIIIL